MIYFIQDKSTCCIKIGYTGKAARDRLKKVQTGCPSGLVLLGIIPGNKALEGKIHARFAGARRPGEWFKPIPRLLRFIIKQLQNHSTPSLLAFPLPEGEYLFAVQSAGLDKENTFSIPGYVAKSERRSVFRMVLQVCGGPFDGTEIHQVSHFLEQQDLNHLGGGFLTLGIDADRWGKRGLKISEEICAASPKLAGLRFRGVVGTYRSRPWVYVIAKEEPATT